MGRAKTICRLGILLLTVAAWGLPARAQPPQAVIPHRVATSAPDPWQTPSESARILPKRGAGEAAKPVTGTKASKPTTSTLWGTVVAIGLLAAGFLVTLRWLKRHGPAVLRALPNEAVEPLGQRVLSRGVAVHLVRCGRRMLLLGVGPDGVRTLAEIDDPVEVDVLAGACRRRDEASAGMAAFAQLLQRSPAGNGSSPTTEGRTTAAGFSLRGREGSGG